MYEIYPPLPGKPRRFSDTGSARDAIRADGYDGYEYRIVLILARVQVVEERSRRLVEIPPWEESL